MSVDPQKYLVENVAVPAYFEKIASETGISPSSGDAAAHLRVLGDRVVNGVILYMDKSAAAQKSNADSLIKAAYDVSDVIGGNPSAAASARSGDALAVPGVRDAALLYLSQLQSQKVAMDGCAPVMPEIKPQVEEEEEEGKKKEPKVVMS